MYSHKNFPENLRILRKTHNLSTILLADIVGLKSQVSITKMENGSSTPLYSTFINIIDLFGVSADWISGRSKIPYEESIISYLEDNLLSISANINLQHNVDLIYYLYIVHIILGINYFKSTKKQLSLQQRANVIYALHFWKYASHRLHNEGYDSQKKPIQQVLRELKCISDTESPDSIINQSIGILSKHLPSYTEQIHMIAACCSSKRAGSIFSKHCEQCIEILRSAKELGSFMPVYFDITKYTDNMS